MPRWNENPHPEKWANMKDVARVLSVHHMAGRNALKVGGVPTFLHKGVRYVTLDNLNTFADTYPKQSWTVKEIETLKAMWGYHPVSSIAERLGRSVTAVSIKSKRLKLRSVASWPRVLTEFRLAPLLNLDRKTVWNHMQPDGIFPAFTLYKRDTPVRIVYEDMMILWLRDFNNWVYFRDVEQIEYPPFAQAIHETKEKINGDQWLMPKEAAELIGIPVRYLNTKIHKGAIRAVKHQYWRVLRSEAVAYREKINYHKKFGGENDRSD